MCSSVGEKVKNKEEKQMKIRIDKYNFESLGAVERERERERELLFT